MSDGDFEEFMKNQQKPNKNVKVLLKPLEAAEVVFLKTILKALPFPGLTIDDIAKHGSLLAFGFVYDYSEEGIKRLSEDCASQFNEKCDAGTTHKSQTELQKWIMDNKDKFSAGKYSAGYNNCLHFIEAACKFLGVSIPKSLTVILDWLRNGGATAIDKAESLRSLSSLNSLSSSAQNLQSCVLA